MPTASKFVVTGQTDAEFEVEWEGDSGPSHTYDVTINQIPIPPVPGGAQDNVYIQMGTKMPPVLHAKLYVVEAQLVNLRAKIGRQGALTYWLGTFQAVMGPYSEGGFRWNGTSRVYECSAEFIIIGT
jgi:hypothetical protein